MLCHPSFHVVLISKLIMLHVSFKWPCLPKNPWQSNIRLIWSQKPIEDQSLPTDCWHHANLCAERGESFSQFSNYLVNTSRPPDFFGALDLNYLYKSVVTQIPYDTWLASMPYTDQKSSPTEDWTSVASCSWMSTGLRTFNSMIYSEFQTRIRSIKIATSVN